MKTKILIGILVSFVVISVVLAAELIAGNGKDKGKGRAPALEKVVFIHWKKGFAKPPCNNNGICEPELGENPSCPDCKNGEEPPPEPSTACYAFMGKYGKTYLKWRELPVSYVVHPALEDCVTGAISAGAEEWDLYSGPELFNDTYVIDDSVAYGDLDGNNALCFDNYYLDPGIIAACTVWYSPATKEIVEFDITFESDFAWGDATGNSELMDLQNIATHELGHGVGLADVYETECSDVTMYGYSMEGETKKRTLEEPDIIGILELYPE